VRIIGSANSSSLTTLTLLRNSCEKFAVSYTEEHHYGDLIPKCHSISRKSEVIISYHIAQI